MTATQVEQMCQKTGMTPDQFAAKVNLCYKLSEIQHLYVAEIDAAMKRSGFRGFEDKHIITTAANQTAKVVKLIRRVTSAEFQENFEDNADELKYLIDKWAGL